MSDAADIIDPDERMLARLAELDASLAEKLHGLAMAESDPEIVASLARGYQRIARSLRQTLALKAKLKGDRERALREQPWPMSVSGPVRDEARTLRAREAVRRAVRRVIAAAEIEQEEADYLTDLLEDRLDHLAAKGALGQKGLDDEVRDLCEDFGLDSDDWRSLPDPPDDDGPGALEAPEEWRSSA